VGLSVSPLVSLGKGGKVNFAVLASTYSPGTTFNLYMGQGARTSRRGGRGYILGGVRSVPRSLEQYNVRPLFLRMGRPHHSPKNDRMFFGGRNTTLSGGLHKSTNFTYAESRGTIFQPLTGPLRRCGCRSWWRRRTRRGMRKTRSWRIRQAAWGRSWPRPERSRTRCCLRDNQ